MKKRVRILVAGRVQGVFFRASTKSVADELGLAGTVRNLPDGGVEVIAEGASESVDAFAAWCRQGPPRARVERLSVIEEAYCREYSDFSILY